MFDKELRQTIGARMKQRRKELHFSLQYVAERMDVTASTIQRYESGAIDNTKRLVIEGLADVLHVSPAWLRGETDEMGADQSDEQIIRIENVVQEILAGYPLGVDDEANTFSKNVLLLLLMEFKRFNGAFEYAVQTYSEENTRFNERLMKITQPMTDIDSTEEFNGAMFAWEVGKFASALTQIADDVRSYGKDPAHAKIDIASSLREFLIAEQD